MALEIVMTARDVEAGAPGTAGSVRHWHVTESGAGYLPEAEPCTSDDSAVALDVLAHLLADWSETCDDPTDPDPDPDPDPDAAYAAAIAEHYCTCRPGERSAEHHDALAAVDDGRGICEQIGHRVFELTPCTGTDCRTDPEGESSWS